MRRPALPVSLFLVRCQRFLVLIVVRTAAVHPRLLLGRGAPQACPRLPQGLLGGTPLPGAVDIAYNAINNTGWSIRLIAMFLSQQKMIHQPDGSTWITSYPIITASFPKLLFFTQSINIFQTLFNIVVIWMAIFIGLSKGLKSYGKVSLIFGVVPIVGLVVFCTKVHMSNLFHICIIILQSITKEIYLKYQ